jgi:hypothetical protein
VERDHAAGELTDHGARGERTLKDFFQRLTQAVAHTKHCAMVATLIASENEQHDATGITVLNELNAVFGRIEENIQPIERDDLPEVLRRRFFDTVPSVEERRPIVNSIMAALQPLAVRDSQKSGEAERRYLDAYPFHPELLDVLYQKWTQLPNYQRTRGALRLIGLALQEAVERDPSPLITPAAFLAYLTTGTGLSPTVAEMLKATEAPDQWRPILDGELGRARAVEAQYPALSERTVEQAVLATFLHSQPRGKRAETADLLGLLGYSGVDHISLIEGLRGWRDSSWFLVEGDDNFWQLDLTPNLNQMHAAAMDRVKPADIEEEINRRVRAASALTQTIEGVRVYTLPKSPNDVEDSPEFRYLVLGPNHAVTAGTEPAPGVTAFFTDLSGPGNPRTYKNALVALAPDRAKLDGLREQIKRWKAWGLVQASDDAKRLSDPQQKKLRGELDGLNGQIPSATQGAWSVMVLVDGDKSTGQRIALSSELLKPIPGKPDAKPFERIVHSLRESERLAPDQIDSELLLPDSYLNLWSAGQTALKVNDLANAFGQFLRLPRLLRPSVLYRSVARGAENGTFVLRLVRSDGSTRTIWREAPSDDDLHRAELEIVPTAYATLDPLPETLLAPGALPGLWPSAPADGVAVAQVAAYFDGAHAPRLVDGAVLERAIRAAVKDGVVMLEIGGDAYHAESLPLDAEVAKGRLIPPPAVIRPADLGPVALPAAWRENATTVGALAEALGTKQGKPIYWPALREALLQADKQQALAVDTGTLLTAPSAERATIPVHSRQVTKLDTDAFIDAKVAEVWQRGAPKLRELKSAIEYATGATVPDSVFLEAARQAATEGKISLPREASSASADVALDLRAQPRRTRIAAEAKLSLAALSDLPEAAQKLRQVAPEMAFEFVVTVSAEGETLSAEQIEQLNAILTKLSPNMRLS